MRCRQWLGDNSDFEAREGEALTVRAPNNATPAKGNVREVVANTRIVFTWRDEAGTHGMTISAPAPARKLRSLTAFWRQGQ